MNNRTAVLSDWLIHPSMSSRACVQILHKHGESLSAGAIITVDQNRLRIRQPIT